MQIFTYVYDFMSSKFTHTDVMGGFAVLDAALQLGSQLLGLEEKLSKHQGREQCLQQLEFLGILFNTVQQEMHISQLRRGHDVDCVHDLLVVEDSALVSLIVLEMTVGRLSFVAQACRWGYSFLQSLCDNLSVSRCPPPRNVILFSKVCTGLLFWWNVLHPNSSMWDGVSPCTRSDTDLMRDSFAGQDGANIFTDASGAGFGTMWGAIEFQGDGSQLERQLHVAGLELRAGLREMQSWPPAVGGIADPSRKDADSPETDNHIDTHGCTRV